MEPVKKEVSDAQRISIQLKPKRPPFKAGYDFPITVSIVVDSGAGDEGSIEVTVEL